MNGEHLKNRRGQKGVAGNTTDKTSSRKLTKNSKEKSRGMSTRSRGEDMPREEGEASVLNAEVVRPSGVVRGLSGRISEVARRVSSGAQSTTSSALATGGANATDSYVDTGGTRETVVMAETGGSTDITGGAGLSSPEYKQMLESPEFKLAVQDELERAKKKEAELKRYEALVYGHESNHNNSQQGTPGYMEAPPSRPPHLPYVQYGVPPLPLVNLSPSPPIYTHVSNMSYGHPDGGMVDIGHPGWSGHMSPRSSVYSMHNRYSAYGSEGDYTGSHDEDEYVLDFNLNPGPHGRLT